MGLFVRKTVWCLPLRGLRGVRARRPTVTKNSVSFENSENLLQDAVTYRELQEPVDDNWASSAYPKIRQLKEERIEAPKVDPRETSVLLFPGQGSQFVGMGKNLVKYPNVNDMYESASEILGYDLLKLCLEGPKERLDKTVYCQPAIFVTSLAAVERLRDDFPMAVQNCVAAAGFSVGEYTALTFAGSMNFEDVNLVNIRAQAMQKASELEPSGLVTVMLRANSSLNLAMETAKKYMKMKNYADPVCQVANDLFVKCKVIGGHEEALKFISENGEKFSLGPMKRLPVSGAFHTVLMESAKNQLEDALRQTRIVEPLISVYSNVTGQKHSSNPVQIKKNLIRQLYRPIHWEQIMHRIFDRRISEVFPAVYELGPGSQLTAMLKRTNGKAAENSKVIGV